MNESEETIYDSLNPKCRICLQEKGRKISPCNCTGTMGYIHEDCLKIWIQKSVERGIRRTCNKQNGYTSFTCQLCNGDIQFKMVREQSCAKADQIRQRICQNKGSFFVMLCVILGMAVIGIVLMVQGITDIISGFYTIWGVVFVFAFVILIFALEVRFLYSFIHTFFRGHEYTITDFKSKNNVVG